MQPSARKIWVARMLIALVLASNLLAAVAFLLQPETFLAAYELEGEVGAAVVRGVGLLFLMWNVPYAVALVHPVRFRVSLFEAIGMQTLAVVGESLILYSIPALHDTLRGSLQRFIVFDVAGLVLLVLAAWGLHSNSQRIRTQHDFIQ